ncbi:DNA polymerase III DnaE [Bacillus sp. SG-1]|nr:DNA polymerase III DnaE [Bacillus sp. SG-1]
MINSEIDNLLPLPAPETEPRTAYIYIYMGLAAYI